MWSVALRWKSEVRGVCRSLPRRCGPRVLRSMRVDSVGTRLVEIGRRNRRRTVGDSVIVATLGCSLGAELCTGVFFGPGGRVRSFAKEVKGNTNEENDDYYTNDDTTNKRFGNCVALNLV
jgi:hypothetical protein